MIIYFSRKSIVYRIWKILLFLNSCCYYCCCYYYYYYYYYEENIDLFHFALEG